MAAPGLMGMAGHAVEPTAAPLLMVITKAGAFLIGPLSWSPGTTEAEGIAAIRALTTQQLLCPPTQRFGGEPRGGLASQASQPTASDPALSWAAPSGSYPRPL